MKKNDGFTLILRAPIDSIDWVLFHHEASSIDRIDFGPQGTNEVTAADFATLSSDADDFPTILGCAEITLLGTKLFAYAVGYPDGEEICKRY